MREEDSFLFIWFMGIGFIVGFFVGLSLGGMF